MCVLEEVTEELWLPVDPRAEFGPSMASHPPLPPGHQWLLTRRSHPTSLECTFCPLLPQWEPFSRVQPWESNVLLRPSGWSMWLDPLKVTIHTFKSPVAGVEIPPLAVAQDKFPMWFPCLPAAYQSGAICVFLWSLPVLCVSGPLCELIAYVRDGLSVWLWE